MGSVLRDTERVTYTVNIMVYRIYTLVLLVLVYTGSTYTETRSVLEVDEDTATEIPQIEIKETQTVTDTNDDDVEVTANEPSNKIKEENIDKCDKCLKSTFRYRHDGFCGKCVSNGIIDVTEQQAINDAMRCKKCKKPKFKSRHLLFCSDNCFEEMRTTSTTTVRTTTRTTSTTTSTVTTTHVPRRSIFDILTKKKHKGDKHKAKDGMEMFRNKEQKQKRREQKRKEKQKRKLLKQKKKLDQTLVTPEDLTLGPLANVLKYLIVANTWN